MDFFCSLEQNVSFLICSKKIFKSAHVANFINAMPSMSPTLHAL